MKAAIGRTILGLALLSFASGTPSTYSAAQTVPQSSYVAPEAAASTNNKDVRLRTASSRDDFHIEEFKALRGEILILKQTQHNIEQWVVVSIGLIYGFAFGIRADAVTKILPTISKRALLGAAFAVSMFGAFFYAVNDYVLYNISDYIKQIESWFTGIDGPNGWEHFQGNDEKRHVWGVLWSPFWWVVLFVTGLGAAVAAFFPKFLRKFLR